MEKERLGGSAPPLREWKGDDKTGAGEGDMWSFNRQLKAFWGGEKEMTSSTTVEEAEKGEAQEIVVKNGKVRGCGK